MGFISNMGTPPKKTKNKKQKKPQQTTTIRSTWTKPHITSSNLPLCTVRADEKTPSHVLCVSMCMYACAYTYRDGGCFAFIVVAFAPCGCCCRGRFDLQTKFGSPRFFLFLLDFLLLFRSQFQCHSKPLGCACDPHPEKRAQR